MSTSHQYSLRWSNYYRHITSAFDHLRAQDDFVDCTLCCDGKKIKAHKVLLSACSGYFKEIFKENPCPHPVIIFNFTKYEDLLAIIEFMYQGEVNVQQDALQSFLHTAELLAVQGLTSEEKEKQKPTKPQISQQALEQQIVKTLPATIRAVTENNTQTQTVEIQANMLQNTSATSTKKRKLAFSDDEVYTTETVEFTKEEPNLVKEVYIAPGTMKMDIPEYIDVAESNQLNETTDQQAQQGSQDTTTQTNATFTSEYEILTEQTAYESEMEEKYEESGDNNEITTVEVGGIFSTQGSGKNTSNDKTINTPESQGNDQSLQCKLCNRQLQSIAALKRHNISKHVERTTKHTCSVCKKSFKTKWSLSTHNSRFHRENRILKEGEKMDLTFMFKQDYTA